MIVLNFSEKGVIIVRNYIIKNKYEFSDFEKNNDEYKKLTLNLIRNEINSTLNPTPIGFNYCKIGTGNFYEEEPCPNSVDINNDVAYDELLIHDPVNFNNITVNHPRRYANLNLNPQNKYIISTNIIQFRDYQNNLIKFGLTRMKVFFGLYSTATNQNLIVNCCRYRKAKGEIIDVGISHFENNVFSQKIDYARYTINNYEFNMPTINYFEHEHYSMLAIIYNLPWDLPKFEKRLDRYFAFALILLLDNINGQNIQELILFLNTYQNHLGLNNQNPNYNKNPLMNNQLIYGLPSQSLNQVQNGIVLEILTLLNQTIGKINLANYNLVLVNFTNFINRLITNIQNMINILNNINIYIQNPNLTFPDNNLSIRTNLFGGFNICSMDNSQKILKNTINKLINFGSFIPLNSNTNDRFYSTYRRLVQIFLNNDPIDQIYFDNLRNQIYNSSTDFTSNMLDSNGNRKILINSILQRGHF